MAEHNELGKQAEDKAMSNLTEKEKEEFSRLADKIIKKEDGE